MSIYTFVVDFGDGPYPRVGRDTHILGGELTAVGGGDAFAELAGVTEQRDELLEAAKLFLAYDHHDHDDFEAMVIDYEAAISAARAAIAKATGAQP